MSNTLLAGATTKSATTTTSTIDKLSQQYQSQRTGTGSTSTKTTGTASGMGQEAFLKMFMAQMTNQNPLDPMDNTEFTAQLAQFSSLEQLTKISKSLDGLTSLQDTMTQTQVLGYLGKEVTMSGNKVTVSGDQIGALSFSLGGNASVKAVVTDANGAVVANKDLGSMNAGTRTFQWDGTTDSGTTAADGTYSVGIVATDSEGTSVKVSDLSVTGLVTGFKKGSDGKTYLLVGNTELPLSTVTGVRQPSSSNSAYDWLNSQYNNYLNSSSSSSSNQSLYDWLKGLASN